MFDFLGIKEQTAVMTLESMNMSFSYNLNLN